VAASSTARFHAAIILQTVIIGPAYTFVTWASTAFPPLALPLLRSSSVALIMLTVFFLRGGFRGKRPTRKTWLKLLGLAAVGVTLNQFCFVLGLRYTTPANGALIYSLTPLFVLFLAVFAFKSERLTRGKLLGASLAILGVLIVFYSLGRRMELNHLLGDGILVVAVTAWSIFIVRSKDVLDGFDAFTGITLVMTLGALLYLPIGIWGLPAVDWAGMGPKPWIGLMCLISINSIAGFVLVNYALRGLQSSQVAVYMNLQPIGAAVFSAWVMQEEELTNLFVLGGLVALAGVYWLNQQRALAAKAAAKAEEVALRPDTESS